MVAQPFELRHKNKQIYDGKGKLLKRFSELFIIIRYTLQENSGIHHVIRDFVGVLERLTKHAPTYYGKFFHIYQVRNWTIGKTML